MRPGRALKREWRRWRHSHGASLRVWARFVGRGELSCAQRCRRWLAAKGIGLEGATVCACETDVENPGDHMRSCRFADPTRDHAQDVPF